MGVETGDLISDLNEAWPDGSELRAEGDNHLRQIKHVLKHAFNDTSTSFTINAGTSQFTFNQDGTISSVGSPLTIGWGSISGKPSTFPPEPHAHPQSDITNLVSDLAAKVGPDVGAADYRFFARRANAWIDFHAYVDPLHIRQWQYTASTSTPPSIQQVRPNNLTLNLATALYFHKTDMSNQAGAVTMLMNLVTTGFTIGFCTSGDPDAWVMYEVTGAPFFTDPYVTIPVVCLSNGSGTISSGARLICTFYAGMDRVLARNNITLYMSPSGSDSNDGLTAGTPLLTFTAVWAKLGNIDISNVNVKIIVADGTYSGETIQPPDAIISHANATYLYPDVVGAICVIGNSASPQNVVIANGAYLNSSIPLYIEGCSLGLPFNGPTANKGLLQVKNCRVGAAGLRAYYTGKLVAEGNISFVPNNSSGQTAHISAYYGGEVQIYYNAVLAYNATGNSVSTAFAHANERGVIRANNGAAFTAGTNPTGPRYVAENGGQIFVPAQNENFFPGTTAGLLYTNGIYGNSTGVTTANKTSAGIAYISDTAPTNPVPGQLWWCSSNGDFFIYYQDANSSQWVQVNSVGN